MQGIQIKKCSLIDVITVEQVSLNLGEFQDNSLS